jgi:hypothetical protein
MNMTLARTIAAVILDDQLLRRNALDGLLAEGAAEAPRR